MGIYSSPKAPDPVATAGAQAGYNQNATTTANILNNPNINTPFGNVTNTQTGSESVQQPDGTYIDVPRYTQDVTLGPAEQAQKDKSDIIKGDLLDVNATKVLNPYTNSYETYGQKDNFRTATTNKFDMSKIDARKYRDNANTLGFMGAGRGDITSDTGSVAYDTPDSFSEDRRRVEEAMMSRGGDLLGQNRDSEVARLSAMGLAPGGENYGRVAQQFEQSANDLAMQSILAGGAEQSRQLGESRAFTGAENERNYNDAAFANAAQNQGYTQDMGRLTSENTRRTNATDLYNDVQTQRFNQDANIQQQQTAQIQMENARRTGDAAAYNAALQAYNAVAQQSTVNARDSASFQNNARQQQINELLGIISGAQIQSPGQPAYQGQAVGSPDFMGAVQSNYQQEVAKYNAMIGGVADIGTAAIGALP